MNLAARATLLPDVLAHYSQRAGESWGRDPRCDQKETGYGNALIAEEAEHVLRRDSLSLKAGQELRPVCSEPPIFEEWHSRMPSRDLSPGLLVRPIRCSLTRAGSPPRTGLLLTLAPQAEHASTALLQTMMSSPHVHTLCNGRPIEAQTQSPPTPCHPPPPAHPSDRRRLGVRDAFGGNAGGGVPLPANAKAEPR